MKRLVIALVLLVTACGSDQACGLVGCASVAWVRLDHLSPTMRFPLSAHVCFDDRCADLTVEQTPPAAGGPVSVPCPGGGQHTCVDLRSTQGYVGVAFGDPPADTRPRAADLVLRDAAGTVVLRSSRELRLAKSAPNGEQCGPICWSGTAVFDGPG